MSSAGRSRAGRAFTQQTAKSILISSEGFQEGTKKSLRRKVRELILALRLEGAFTKEQILWLYLNGVYLGHHSYGVQAAAENYYRKNVGDLTLEEAALLAGLPQAPRSTRRFAHPETAKERRRYVLRRMFEEGMITADERERASEAEVNVHGVDDVFRETAPFYVEQVRRQVVDRYGNERLLHDGLRVEMAMDLEKQRAAQTAMLSGLLEVDRRQGYYGALLRVQGAERKASRTGWSAPGLWARSPWATTPSGSSRGSTRRRTSSASRSAPTRGSSRSPACAGRGARTRRSPTRMGSSRARGACSSPATSSSCDESRARR